jgi:hypothetical protein
MFIEEQGWAQAMGDFRPRFEHLFHRLSALRHRLPELESRRWRRVVFVIDETLDPAAKVEELRRRYGAVTVTVVDPPTSREDAQDRLTVVSIDGSRVVSAHPALPAN